MPELLIMIPVVVLLTLTLGLPLLVKPGSRIPDYIGAGLLGLIILGFAWSTGDWWVLVPVLAIAASVVWMDKGARQPSGPLDSGGMSKAARLRFRLWRAAHDVGLALIIGLVILMATDIRLLPIDALADALLVTMAASFAFRFSLKSALAHGERARSGATEAIDAQVA